MWECGLKPVQGKGEDGVQASLLMWECGLKPYNRPDNYRKLLVTPYVGVWIETVTNLLA